MNYRTKFLTMQRIKVINILAGGYYFSKDAIRFFGTVKMDNPGGGPFFYMQNRNNKLKQYSVAVLLPSGKIKNLEASGAHRSLAACKDFVKHLNIRWHKHAI